MAVLAEQTVEMAVQQIILGVKDKEVPQEHGDLQPVHCMPEEVEAEEVDQVIHTLREAQEVPEVEALVAEADIKSMPEMMSITITMAQMEWLGRPILEEVEAEVDTILMKIQTVDVIMDIRPKVGLELY